MAGIITRDRRLRRATGIVRTRVFRRGVLIEESEISNLIVGAELNILANLIAGSANWAITQFGVGSNGAAPNTGNTTLTNQFLTGFTSVGVNGAQTSFNFSIGTGDANGMAISEFGLLTLGGVLYARQVRAAPLQKTTDISFTGTWQVTQ